MQLRVFVPLLKVHKIDEFCVINGNGVEDHAINAFEQYDLFLLLEYIHLHAIK